ncbi:hypothetical protein P168DRAFT_287916 [Aspergillus campestris IBT 28561]|uniref:Uncharacterized protein n=1 Tax=Aspergillus campestris (strain IBT 28561) TaxID=1392248 RepID=A0A2I1DC23_ASPC2|nr:uncharacterized protein P168DRAFT_287916 [Aspergillus campestris IBT 28561]PKY07435.1 hypothetical protein P168DRAFT_287916 [Aspergillus campestris IBT 28561]
MTLTSLQQSVLHNIFHTLPVSNREHGRVRSYIERTDTDQQALTREAQIQRTPSPIMTSPAPVIFISFNNQLD